MREVELAIIGAGPAGISAAIQAAELGVKATLIDESHMPGGQIYQRVPPSFIVKDIKQMGKDYVKGQTLIAELDKNRSAIEFLDYATVWGVFGDKTIEIVRNGKNDTLKATKLIIAEGAYERPMPFPGWTLPGVISAGGVQRMVKIQKVLPGKKFILTGTGPLQLVVAYQLVQAGAEVVAVLEASPPHGLWWKTIPRMWDQLELIKDAFQYLNELRKAKVPLRYPYAVVKANGVDRVDSVTYAEMDREWRPISGTEKIAEVDTLCVGYGFISSARISGLLGCKQRYEHELGGWIPEHDSYMETSQQGVFVAGDGAGVAGSIVAAEEGRLSSIRASAQLGRIGDDEARRLCLPILTKLKKMKKFRNALDQISKTRLGWFSRIRDDTVICRCEEITAGQIRKAIQEGATHVNEIKFLCRAGMGHCQGRMCESSVAALIAVETSRSIEESGYFTSRPPVRPIPLIRVIG